MRAAGDPKCVCELCAFLAVPSGMFTVCAHNPLLLVRWAADAAKKWKPVHSSRPWFGFSMRLLNVGRSCLSLATSIMFGPSTQPPARRLHSRAPSSAANRSPAPRLARRPSQILQKDQPDLTLLAVAVRSDLAPQRLATAIYMRAQTLSSGCTTTPRAYARAIARVGTSSRLLLRALAGDMGYR